MTKWVSDALWAHIVQRLNPLPFSRTELEEWLNRAPDREELLAWLASDRLGSRAEYEDRLRSEESTWISPAPSEAERQRIRALV